MGLMRLPLLAATAMSLAVAAPAAAVSGFGVSSALRHEAAVTIAVTGSKKSATHTCQAGSNKREPAPAKSTVIGSPRKYAVVACEQPPKSEVVTSGLKQASIAALATIG
jgi:hypothetical protein